MTTRESIMRGGIVLALLGAGVLGAAVVTLRAAESRAWRGPSTTAASPADTIHAQAVLDAVRGENALACSLTASALRNHFGGRNDLGGPDAARLDSASRAAYAWVERGPIGADVVPLLRRAMADADPCVRRTAAELAGESNVKNLAELLHDDLSSADAARRETAALALGYVGNVTTVGALAGLASDADARVRRTVAWALGESDAQAAAPALERMLGDADAPVRVNAALGLGSLSVAAAIPALTQVLARDADASVRRAAAAALGEMDR